ncbi:JmjC domain-containing protein [Glacieibacterium sp.]|uniref:JmjC domain-containing protein n=1 Tax=Glacieibacterium sp. TaxID=2860237 RepID=UPI003AFFB46A
MQLADFDIAAFLRDHWQQKPLLIRNPWKAWHNPLDPDELAGLACEAEVESRLVTRTPKSWKAEDGPFDEARIAKLGKKRWTLLVQAVDHYVPEVAALIEPFRFIPDWRIDDVMVSYATDGGGVGPHFDQYDVFLIQGLGTRRWQVGPRCDQSSPLLPHADLRLLADFTATDEWLLEPGDILYVPPGFAHDGVAVGDDCMTYSIGFRAPSRSDLLGNWCDHLLETLQDEDRYADPALPQQDNPGEITAEAITRLHRMITDKLLDRDGFARWFGEYNSAPKYPDVDWQPEEPVQAAGVRELLAAGSPLYRNPASRFAFVRQPAGGVSLFVDGECFACSGDTAALAEQLCARDRVELDPALAGSKVAVALLVELLNQGSATFDAPD